MAWDKTTHRAITQARLKLSPPEVVYEALEAYGKNASSGPFTWDTDEDLELALEARGDPLINLGLAKNASNRDLLWRLYARAREGSEDQQYDQAVRLACLDNRVARGLLFSWHTAGLNAEEERRLALEGNNEEMMVWMQNPSAGGVLRDAYARTGSFADIPDERWQFLVQASTGNPRLNIDNSNEDGPDMLAWDIHEAIFRMLQEAPATENWLRTLYFLLCNLNKAAAKTPGLGETDQVLDRWAGVKVPKTSKKNETEDDEGWYTDLSFASEFRCLVAALYGRTFDKNSIEIQGSPDHADIARRCAYYGNAKLTPEQVQSGFEKDGSALCLAAIFNDGVLLDRKSRAALEPLIRDRLLRLYDGRCSQLAKQWHWFDRKPVSKDLAEALLLARADGEGQPQRDAELFANLAKEVADLKGQLQNGMAAQVKSLMTVTTWGLIAIGALILFKH